MTLLGTWHRYYGNFDEALPLHKKALTIREQNFGASHTAIAQSLADLSFWYSD